MVQGQALRLGKKPNPKFERCVKEVEAQGQSPAKAHTFCNKSVKKKGTRRPS